jgi:hypothetical protein
VKTAALITRISWALEQYERGDRLAALLALDGIEGDPLPDHPAWLANEAARRAEGAQKGYLDPTAARDWIDLARDRLRAEMGVNVGTLTPVPLALNSALACLGAGVCTDRKG